MVLETLIEKYAKLIVEFGVNVRKDKYLVIQADIECSQLVKYITKYAFEKGVKDVVVHYSDINVDLYRGLKVEAHRIETLLPWQQESLKYYFDKGADSIILKNIYPTVLKALSEESANAFSTVANAARNIVRESVAKQGSHWCIVDVPNKDWAQYLFPDLMEEEALVRLWEVLLEICKIDDMSNPVENWHEDRKLFWRYKQVLDSMKIDTIHFTNSLGTDMVVGLREESRWTCGIESIDFNEEVYLPNIPTAEIATSPDKFKAEGTVVSTKPIIVGGKIIDHFKLEFKEGRVVKFSAEEGEELLEKLLHTDEGSSYLGEVALVCKKSTIAKTNRLFYSTLFDENAACHMALGKGFPQCIEGFDSNNPDEWEKHHLNNAAIHIDFMFGSEDLKAVATTKQGNKIVLMENGSILI